MRLLSITKEKCLENDGYQENDRYNIKNEHVNTDRNRVSGLHCGSGSGGGSGSGSNSCNVIPNIAAIKDHISIDIIDRRISFDRDNGDYHNNNPYTNGDYVTTPLNYYETFEGTPVEYDVYDMSRLDESSTGSNLSTYESELEYQGQYGKAEKALAVAGIKIQRKR